MSVRLVWAVLAAVGVAIFVTYWRVPPEQLYNVSDEGLRSGAGRALVFSNYPVSLVAIPVAWLAAERITRRGAWVAAAVASGLCAVTAWPGVVDQQDLDAKTINVLPDAGVVIALTLTRRAPWKRVGPRRLDPLRIGLAAVLVVVAIPWFFAVLGFYAPGDVFLGEELRRSGDGRLAPAVHLGDHEGLDGTLLVLSALVLSRLRARLPVTFAIALVFVYGLAVAAADAWQEQVVKRGWSDVKLPTPLHPAANLTWVVVVALAAVVTVALRRLEGPLPRDGGPRRTSPSRTHDRPPAGSTRGAPSP